MSVAEQYQRLARASQETAAAVSTVARAISGLGIRSDEIARGTATATDSELRTNSVAAHAATRRALAALERAALAARRAAVEAAAEEERARRAARPGGRRS